MPPGTRCQHCSRVYATRTGDCTPLSCPLPGSVGLTVPTAHRRARNHQTGPGLAHVVQTSGSSASATTTIFDAEFSSAPTTRCSRPRRRRPRRVRIAAPPGGFDDESDQQSAPPRGSSVERDGFGPVHDGPRRRHAPQTLTACFVRGPLIVGTTSEFDRSSGTFIARLDVPQDRCVGSVPTHGHR